MPSASAGDPADPAASAADAAAPGDPAASAADPADPAASADAAAPPTSERLLATAAEHFCRKGYAQTTTRELADALGIRKASPYHHISNKEELLLAIAMHSLDHILAEVGAVIEAAPPERRLQALIDAHVVNAVRERDMHTVMLSEMRALSERHHDEVVAKRDEYEAMLRAVIAADQEAGRLRTDIDAKMLTLALLNVLNWTIFWFRPGDDLSPERVAALLGGIYVEGVGAG